MEQRQSGRKADESFFFEWDEREQHAEDSKKRERSMAGGRLMCGGSEPSLGSQLESGQRGACRLW